MSGPDTTKLKIPVPPHADSLIRRDSTGVPRKVPLPQPSDTVQPPLAHAPIPRLLRSDRALHFDRAQIFATGSLTLQDLLARVLIATPLSAGYVSAPANVAVGGDFRRTRVFIDGIEYDALDARSNGIVDYSQIQLWSAEDITIEQSATEVRVHLRTWRVDNTSPYTRLGHRHRRPAAQSVSRLLRPAFRWRTGDPARRATVRNDAAELPRIERRSARDHRTLRMGGQGVQHRRFRDARQPASRRHPRVRSRRFAARRGIDAHRRVSAVWVPRCRHERDLGSGRHQQGRIQIQTRP